MAPQLVKLSSDPIKIVPKVDVKIPEPPNRQPSPKVKIPSPVKTSPKSVQKPEIKEVSKMLDNSYNIEN